MIIHPDESIKGASYGLQLWFSILVPAMLPFFIVAELLMALGLARIIGILTEPIMKPIFRLPGSSSLAVVMGFTSGFPVGAIVTMGLFEQKLIKKEEAERLIAFSNNSSPLFILGVLGVGMFDSLSIGYLLLASHYLSNLIVGILLRFTLEAPASSISNEKNMFKEVKEALIAGNEGIEKILKEAIQKSINNILAIAGYLIIFSLIIRMLSFWGILEYLSQWITKIFSFLSIDYFSSYALTMSIFEITIASQTLASSQADLLLKLILISVMLSFSGLAIIMQISGIVAKHSIKLNYYYLARLLQIIISVVLTYSFYHLFLVNYESVLVLSGYGHIEKILYSINAWSFSIYCLWLSFAILIILSIYTILKNIKLPYH